MKKFIGILVGLTFLVGVLCTPVFVQAEEDSTSTEPNIIQTLLQKIEELKTKILELKTKIETFRQMKGEEKQEAKEEVKETKEQIKETLKLTKYLYEGLTNEEIELLQEVLATDPEIYPEGLVTGYFGALTKRAVKRFQKLAGIEQVGVVGPITRAKINELLEEGAGKSGKVPPGLLISPGIRKKLGFEPQPLEGQELPPGIGKKLDQDEDENEEEEEEDTTAPVISDITATSTTASSTEITWTTDEDADSKVWYDTVTPLVVSTSTSVVSSSDLTTDHELMLTELAASTTYYYLVTSADEVGNNATGTEQSFTTLAE